METAKRENNKKRSVKIISGRGVPDLSGWTNDPEELDYISSLPFKYDRLNADLVMRIILNNSKASMADRLRSTRKLKAKLADSGGKARDGEFELKLSKTSQGRQQLEIKLS